MGPGSSRGILLTLGIALGFPTAACAQSGRTDAPPAPPMNAGIRSVPGVFAGHHTLEERPTGCTVILTPDGAVGAVDVRGGAPGTRETDLLDPANSVQEVHGIVLSGGSAFGLSTADGVSRFLEARDVGFPAGPVKVPIVPAAILFDLSIGDPGVRPGPECGGLAAEAAISGSGRLAEGNVGAGAGATVGKLAGMDRAMKGGIGNASVELSSGLVVAAVVAVNPVGDVIDPATGRVLAGVRTEDGERLADARRLIREGVAREAPPPVNTVIGVVATNATLTQAEATHVARMAQAGLARAVVPSHTPWDGDTLFAIATGELGGADDAEDAEDVENAKDAERSGSAERADVLRIGALAADVVAESIVRAVRAAESIDGIPAMKDLPGARATP